MFTGVIHAKNEPELIWEIKNNNEKLQVAKSYIKSMRLKQAIELLNQIIKDEPESREAHYLKGIALYFLGYSELAENELDKSIEENIELYISDLVEKKPAAGIKNILDRQKQAEKFYDYAEELIMEGKFEEASVWLRKAYAMNPSSWEVLKRLGDIYTDLGKYNLAFVSYKKAMSLSSHDSSIANRISFVLTKLGKFSLARRYANISKGKFFNSVNTRQFARVIEREGDIIKISVGLDNGLHQGDEFKRRFKVVRNKNEIGEVMVTQLYPKAGKAIILKERGEGIKLGDLVILR